MPLHRQLKFIPAVIAVVAMVAFAVLWIGARTPLARGLAAGWISDATGLPATVAELRIGFLPSPALDIGGLSIAQPPGFGGEPMFEIGRLRLSLPWRSVFGGTRVQAISISDAIARLVVGADGVTNWAAMYAKPGAGGGQAAAPAWYLGTFDLERGTVEYRDAGADTHWQLTAITATARDVGPAVEFPIELRLGGVFGPNTVHYAVKGRGRLDLDAGRYEGGGLEFRGWAGGDPLPLAGVELTGALGRASYESGTGIARLDAGRFNLAGVPGRFEGRIELDEPSLVAAIRVATEPFAPRAPALIFGHPLPATSDPAAFESLQLVLQARIQDGVLQLDPVSGRLDDTNFEGRVVPGQRLVRASLDRIDINRYLPATARTVSKKKETLEAAVAELAEFDLDAEIRIAEARIAGAKFRDTVVRVERNEQPRP